MTSLTQIRIRRRMRQADLARKLNISRAAVHYAERDGLRSVSSARKYAAVLCCDWREIIGEAGTESYPSQAGNHPNGASALFPENNPGSDPR